jgi:hypothetical protein
LPRFRQPIQPGRPRFQLGHISLHERGRLHTFKPVFLFHPPVQQASVGLPVLGVVYLVHLGQPTPEVVQVVAKTANAAQHHIYPGSRLVGNLVALADNIEGL